MDAAVRFQAQEQIPMPLDQAVLEHQVVGGVPAEEGSAPQVDVVVVAARRDMISSFIEPIRRAGLEPVGVDLSAFGMIRALAGGARSPPAPTARRAVRRGRPLLQPRRRHEPRRRARPGLPLHPRLPRRPRGDRGRLAASAASPPSTRSQWLTHVGLEQPARGRSRATRRRRRGPPRARGGRHRARRRAAPLARLLRRPGGSAVPVERVVLCGPGSAIPGLAQRMESRPRSADRRRPSAGARRVRRGARRRGSPFPTAWRWRARCARSI